MGKHFTVQWHLGEWCNLRCRHCYQEAHQPVQLGLDELTLIFNQYMAFLDKKGMWGHISLTGGEPIANPHLFDILNLIKKENENGRKLTFSVLTNGTLIDMNIAEKIASYKPEYVQVSVEGGKMVNDLIRGIGSLKKALSGIDCLKACGIYTSISFTATKLNYKDFPRVVKLARKHKVDNVWSDRFIPIGGAAQDRELALTLEETQDYLDILDRERTKLMSRRHKKNITTISMYRALQFFRTGNFPYGCSAGDNLLTIMENGDLVPCRRMPVVAGNLFKKPLGKIYEESRILKDLRRKAIPDDCKNCEESQLCRGGLKCLTYALYGELNHKDVGCRGVL